MRTRKVNRYYCEYCKKSGGSASHMVRHEKHCTLNPNRWCRVCELIEGYRRPLEELIAVLPDIIEKPDGFGSVTVECEGLKEAVKELRDLADGCPACMMAALRQKGIPVPMARPEFDFKAEMAAIFEQVHAANAGYFGD